jgi:hypothetical protein
MRDAFAKIVCSLLVVSTMAAQQQPSAEKNCGCQEYRVGTPAVKSIQRYYGGLPRTHDEDVAVVLYLPANKSGCCALTNNPTQTGIFPVKFELHESPEFRVRFRSGFKYKSHNAGTPIEMVAGEKIVLLKLRANHDAPLGEYVLQGKLTYQAVQDHKLQPPQELEVIIPVKVVNETSKVEKIDWPFGTHVKRTLIRIIALPVEIPAAALLAIACSTPKGCDL